MSLHADVVDKSESAHRSEKEAVNQSDGVEKHFYIQVWNDIFSVD